MYMQLSATNGFVSTLREQQPSLDCRFTIVKRITNSFHIKDKSSIHLKINLIGYSNLFRYTYVVTFSDRPLTHTDLSCLFQLVKIYVPISEEIMLLFYSAVLHNFNITRYRNSLVNKTHICSNWKYDIYKSNHLCWTLSNFSFERSAAFHLANDYYIEYNFKWLRTINTLSWATLRQ